MLPWFKIEQNKGTYGGAWSLYISMIVTIPWQVMVNLPAMSVAVQKGGKHNESTIRRYCYEAV